MKPYHKFVFNQKTKEFIGDFEGMYKAGEEQGFDTWEQENLMTMDNQLTLDVLSYIDVKSILDLGCGKGKIGAYIAKHTNSFYTGVDISGTVVKLAEHRNENHNFIEMNINDINELKGLLSKRVYDLIILKDVLAYCSNWKEIIRLCKLSAHYVYVCQYIPSDAIGYIKIVGELGDAIGSPKIFIATDEELYIWLKKGNV